MKAKYTALIFVTLVVAIILFFFFWQNQKVKNVKVLNYTNLMYPLWVAESKGYLGDKIKIEETEIPDTIDPVEDWNKANEDFEKWMGNDGPDIAIISTDNLFSIEALYPGRYKAFGFVSDTEDQYMTNIVVPVDSLINSESDLKGKTIATNVYDVDQLFLNSYINEVEVDGFKTLKMTNSNIDRYIEEKKVDAIWVQEPKTSQLVSENKAKVIIKSPGSKIEEELRGVPYRIFVMRSDFINKNKKTAEKIIDALRGANKVSESEVRSVMVERLGDNNKKWIDARTFAKIDLPDTLDKTKLEKVGMILFDGKYIEKRPEVNNLIYK